MPLDTDTDNWQVRFKIGSRQTEAGFVGAVHITVIGTDHELCFHPPEIFATASDAVEFCTTWSEDLLNYLREGGKSIEVFETTAN